MGGYKGKSGFTLSKETQFIPGTGSGRSTSQSPSPMKKIEEDLQNQEKMGLTTGV